MGVGNFQITIGIIAAFTLLSNAEAVVLTCTIEHYTVVNQELLTPETQKEMTTGDGCARPSAL
jgi:hypothetical protein